MFVFTWMLILLCSRQAAAGYIETVIVSGCESCTLRLICRHMNAVVVILEANFTSESNDTIISNSSLVVPTSFPPIHPRQALNQRCSGVHVCNFILTEDCPGAETWGEGTLTVKYACVSEDRIKTYCNSEIVLPSNQDSGISEGFIRNPGYPRFYSSQRECRWKIRAPYQQRILVKILDIAVTSDKVILPHGCSDRLDIVDSGQLVQSTCMQQHPPLEVLSQSDTMELVLKSTHSLVPLRGVLVQYTAVGCPTPPAPEDGYLVYRNDTAAEYRCCVGFVFPDDGRRSRVISCLGAFWDAPLPLPNCQRKIPPSFVQETKKSTTKKEMASELLAPALLIVALFLINFIVLFYIYKVKQKHAIEFADEELGTLPVSINDPTSP